ncbi:MAG: 30S ribosomal protein S18, partial [Ruminococcus sp.]|nr:30S ribosomal protein S18 [Ruminococcus sp.]
MAYNNNAAYDLNLFDEENTYSSAAPKRREEEPVRKPKKKVCAYCADSNLEIDYKNVEKLRKYVSEKGKILPRRVTGLCAKHQRELTIAIKRAR